jgi:phosphoribosylanthranilate isomerase
MASLLAALAGIRAVQWHGEAPDAAHPEFFRLIAAFGVAEPVDVVRMGAYLRACRERGHTPAAVLVDARVAGLHGGTGRPAPWHLLADFTPGVPLILAGGLTPENVAEAIRIVRPFAVDVTSGVEAGPGRKDREKMRRFLDVVRSL